MKFINYILLLTILLCSCEEPSSTPVLEEPSIPNYIEGSGTTYYISEGGNDNNSGTTPSSPWKTFNNLDSIEPGDKILFNKGDTFSGPLYPQSGNANNWIKYGSYGTGNKPIIKGSVDLSSDTNWVDQTGNIWKSNIQSDNYEVGSIFMNNLDIVGTKEWVKPDIDTQGDFYFDESDRFLYVYSLGNPGSYYSNIDVSLTNHVIHIDDTSYVLFEDLHITQGSAHGFGGSDTNNLIIRGCNFSFIGGGALAGLDRVRYGNGIEFWGNSKNLLVDGNNFWEIFDTAVTNQNHTQTTTQENIYYINNVMRNCGLASFELWNRPNSSKIENIYFLHNTSINPGHGWGDVREDKNSYHVASFGSSASASNLVIKNNIFYTSETPDGVDNRSNFHLFFLDENINGNYSNYVIDYNIWSIPDPLWAISTSDLNPPDTLNIWQDLNNQSIHGIIDAPIFTNFAENDFTLTVGSPGIDDGVLSERTTDFYGITVVGTPDIGAYEN
ncbi:MAG: hypothetical protein OCD02_06305 [Spirochaetaceae bacterium]